jgi:hypothetical protein
MEKRGVSDNRDLSTNLTIILLTVLILVVAGVYFFL